MQGHNNISVSDECFPLFMYHNDTKLSYIIPNHTEYALYKIHVYEKCGFMSDGCLNIVVEMVCDNWANRF